jgi:hypothetical protein
MEFIKNHYEKVILSIVLLGLAVVVAFLPSKMPGADDAAPSGKGAKLEPINLETNETPIKRMEQLGTVDLSTGHRLFNPVQWRRYKDGSLRKFVSENEIGQGALQILKITPLYFQLSFDGAMPPKFQFGVVRENHRNPSLRGRVPEIAGKGEKKELFKVVDFKGAIEDPTEIQLELINGENITISKEKPYKAIVGYTADLLYPPDRLPVFYGKRVGDKLIFDGDTNNIVDIESNQVVISSSSGKRTKIGFKAAP